MIKRTLIKMIRFGESNWSRGKVSIVQSVTRWAQMQFGERHVSGTDGSQADGRTAPPGRCCSCSHVTRCSWTCRWAGCDPVTTHPQRSHNGRWLPCVWRVTTFRISNTDIKYNLNIVQAGFLRLAEMDHSDIQTSDISVVEQNAKVFWVFLLF